MNNLTGNMGINLSNEINVVAHSLSLFENNKITDVREIFLSKIDALNNIVGIAPETLNTLAKLGEAINNDSNFYNTLIQHLSFKANTIDVYTKLQTYSEPEVNNMMNQKLVYLDSQLILKANVLQTYSRGTIDTNIETLRADTATKLTLHYNKTQTFSQSEFNDKFVQALTAQTTALAPKANTADVYTKFLTYSKEQTFSQTEVNDMFTQTLVLTTGEANATDV